MIAGGAPLEPDTARFFDRIGIPLLQGYGLTETSPVIAVNTLQANRIGSVGRPLAGAEVMIAGRNGSSDEGEICTRGPHVMKGYYRHDDLTREAIDADGWFHTGDLGRLDKDGFLYITGRIKNLIVLGGGKKVHPEEVEEALAKAPSVKEICVLGEKATDGLKAGTEEVVAVVVPTEAAAQARVGDPAALQMQIKRELDAAGKDLAPYKRPIRVVLHLNDLPRTATRKVKRADVRMWLSSVAKPAGS